MAKRSLIARLDVVNRAIGMGVCWLAVVIVFLQFSIVLLRYIFGISYIFLSEAVLYLHASLFMVGAAYALRDDAHVRVDIVYAALSPRIRALIDVVGALLFLLPSMALLILTSRGFVYRSWFHLEGAISVGGIPASFLLKSLIPIFSLLMILAAIVRFTGDWRILWRRAPGYDL